MIQIIYDPFKMYKGSNCLYIDTPGDYMESRIKITGSNGDLKLVVRNRGMKNYYDDLVFTDLAEFREIDPLKKLLKMFPVKLSVSSVIRQNPGIVTELNLIEKARVTPFPAYRIEKLEDWILYVFAGSPWHKNEIDEFLELKKLVDSTDVLFHKRQLKYIVNLCMDKLNGFDSSKPEIRTIVRWLSENFQTRAKYLAVAKALENYPDEKKALWLQKDGIWSEICQIPEYHQVIQSMPVFQIKKYKNILPSYQIGKYLRKTLDDFKTLEELLNLIHITSGYLDIEVEEFHNFLRRKVLEGEILENEVLWKIIEKFKHPNGNNLVCYAKMLLKPEKIPKKLSPDSGWSQVKQWLAREYFPYYKWAKNYDMVSITGDIVASFEDWLITNYKNLQWNNDVFINNILRMCKHSIDKVFDMDYSLLLIIMDGIGFHYVKLLNELSEEAGFFPVEETKPFLSFLPTLTGINKSALLRGKLPLQLDSGISGIDDYKKLFADFLETDISNVIADIDKKHSISEMMKQKAEYYLYFLNRTDGYIHEQVPRFTLDRNIEKEIRSFFINLKEGIRNYSAVNENPLFIAITADHGHSILTKTGESLAVGDEGIISHGRVTSQVSDEVDETLFHKLGNEDGEVRFIARGYNWFGTKPKGTVHGGMTPQETVVPSMLYSSEKIVSHKPLIVGIKGEIKRGKADNPMELKIINPNYHKVNIVSISSSLFAEIQLSESSVKKELSIPVVVDGSGIKEQQVRIFIDIGYSISGRLKKQKIPLIIKTTGAATTNLDFEDEFDV